MTIIQAPTMGNELVEKSARPRSVQQAPPYISRAPFYIQNPTLFTSDQWRIVAKEPVTRLCIRHVIREICALEYDISSDKGKDDDGTKTYFLQLLEDADDGEGWDAFLSRILQDAMELPIGGVIEVAPDDITGMAGGMYHVDGATVYPTYDRNIPFVQINPYDSAQRVYFRRGQISRLMLMPRVDLRRKPFQEAPVESAFMAIEALSRMYIYYMKQLGDTPMAGILDLMDMSEGEANEWAVEFREMYEGIDPLKIPILYDHIKPAKFIPMGRNPMDLAIIENYRRFAELVASAFGLSIGDLRLFEHDRVLAGVEASQRVTARSGIGYYAQTIEDFINKNILFSVSSGLKFKFKLGMTGETQAELQLNKTRVEILMTMTGSQPILKPADAQKQAEAWGIIDVPFTGLPPAQPAGGAASGGAGMDGMGALLGAGDNMDSINNDTAAVDNLEEQSKSPDLLANDALAGMGEPYSQSDYADYFKSYAIEEKALKKKPTYLGKMVNQKGVQPGDPEFKEEEHPRGPGGKFTESPDDEEDSPTVGKKITALAGTLQKGDSVDLGNGVTGQALGLARKTQKEAQQRADWWQKALGQPVTVTEKNGLWQVVVPGKLPPQSVISGAKKAENIKEGAEVTVLHQGYNKKGIYSGAKRYNLAEAEKQAEFMTKDSQYQHVVHQVGGVFLIIKLGGQAAAKTTAKKMANYNWTGMTPFGTKEATTLTHAPKIGDKVHYNGTIYQPVAKKPGSTAAKMFSVESTAVKESKKITDGGTFPYVSSSQGTQHVVAQVLSTATGEKPVSDVSPEKKLYDAVVGGSVGFIGSVETTVSDFKEGNLATTLAGAVVQFYGTAVYPTAAEANAAAKKLAAEKGLSTGYVTLKGNKGQFVVAGKVAGAPQALTPAVKEPENPYLDTSLIEYPKVGDKVMLPDGAILEIADVVSEAGNHWFWNGKNGYKNANLLTAKTGIQHFPLETIAPPNTQNTKTAWYVGKVIQIGLTTPAQPTQLPVPDHMIKTTATVSAYTPSYGGKAAIAEPIVIPPPDPLNVPARPAVTPFPNDLSNFPESLDALTMVKSLGGSTGAKLMKDANGNQFVVKYGANAGHARAEDLANKVYRASGVRVPDSRIYDTEKGPASVARYIDGAVTLGAYMAKGKNPDVVRAKVRAGFAADALLANWDVIGMDADNILVDKDLNVWRVDNGGTFTYRAQGDTTAKTSSGWWGDAVQDLWSLRDPSKGQLASYVSDLSWSEITDQMQDISSQVKTIMDSMPDDSEFKATLVERVDSMTHLVNQSRPMLQDHFDPVHVENMAQAITGLQVAGVVKQMPASLTPPGGANKAGIYDTFNWVDEKGKTWDSLRGDGTKTNIMAKFVNFVDANGGSSQYLSDWFNSQAGSSWSDIATAMQHHISTLTDHPKTDFYWQKSAEATFNKVAASHGGVDKVKKSLEMYHAFVYEILSRIDIPNKDNTAQTVRVFRTESDNVLSKYHIGKGIEEGAKQSDDHVYPRAPYSSTSIVKPASIHGHQLFVQHVPWHRILGVYFHSRNGHDNTGAFYGDGENEFLAMLHNTKSTYYHN